MQVPEAIGLDTHDKMESMDDESVYMDDLKTADIVSGPMQTHMQRIYTLTTPIFEDVIAKRPVNPQDWGELIITLANLYRDCTVLSLRLATAIARGYLE